MKVVQRRQAYYSKYHIVRRISNDDVLTECDRVMRPLTKEGSLIWAESEELSKTDIDPVCLERIDAYRKERIGASK